MSFLCEIEPFDTMAFRDGRPFEQNDEGLAETTGIFPPPPPAIAGAVKAAMAATLGVGENENIDRAWVALADEWTGDRDPARKAKGAHLKQILSATITSPFLTRRLAEQVAISDVLVPCPRDLLFGETDEKITGRLAPGTSVKTKANFPAGGENVELNCCSSRPKAKSTAWIGLPALIANISNPEKLPGSHLETGQFVVPKTHIGIAIDKTLGRARDGMLYAASHQRFRESNNYKLGVAAFVQDVDYFPFDEIVPFGGEGRFARIRSHAHSCPFTPTVALPAGKGLRVVALTPVQASPDKPFGLALPGNIATAFEVFACVCDRPAAYGFYHPAMSGSAVIVHAYAAGSVWYLRRRDKNKEKMTLDITAGDRLGPSEFHSYGFGAFVGGPL